MIDWQQNIHLWFFLIFLGSISSSTTSLPSTIVDENLQNFDNSGESDIISDGNQNNQNYIDENSSAVLDGVVQTNNGHQDDESAGAHKQTVKHAAAQLIDVYKQLHTYLQQAQHYEEAETKVFSLYFLI